MSLLGFDALGRLALGQITRGAATTTILVASSGSFALTGNAATFQTTEATAAGSFALAGVSIAFQITENVGAGAYALAGNAATFKVTFALAAGAFLLNGFPANEPVTENVLPGSFVLTGIPAPLSRSGFDYDFQQGGIGHLLYERELARQLAKITRKAPAPVDRRTAPTFKPIGSPQVAAPTPVAHPSELQNQRTAALASAAATRKRREAEAVLLLAS